jgi:hypothetical protein
MMSASNMPVPDSGVQQATRCLLLPAFVFIDNVTPSNVPALIDDVINPASINISKPSGCRTSGAPSLSADSQLLIRQCPYDYLILLCSHKTRDARCGQSAPIIKKELERHLRPLGLLRDLDDERPGGVGIYFVSHVGGHKFAANMLVYRRAGTPGAEFVPEEDDSATALVNYANGASTKMVVHETYSFETKTESPEVTTLSQPNGIAPESNKAQVAVVTNGSVARTIEAVSLPEVQNPHVNKTQNGTLENGSAGNVTPGLVNGASPEVLTNTSEGGEPTTNGILHNGEHTPPNPATAHHELISDKADNGATVAPIETAKQESEDPPGNTVSENGVPNLENGIKSHEVDAKQEEKRPEVGQCIWLARVRPEDCENIVQYTILKGKVVKPQQQLRGGFDRCKQLVSW